MKSEEDEAFDELAKRQGDWGGGYQAKKAMAADKMHWSDCAVNNGPAYPAGECDCGAWQRNNWRCGHGWLRGEQCEICNAAQEPVAWVGLTDADIERIKLMTYEKETNDDGEEQEAVNIDWLIKTVEHFCKEKNT